MTNEILIVHRAKDGINEIDYVVKDQSGQIIVDHKHGDSKNHFLPGRYYFKGTKVTYQYNLNGKVTQKVSVL